MLPLLSALAAIVALGIWQTRALISGQVLGAPVLGAATSIARERLSGVVTRATATFLLILTLSGFLFLLFSSSSTQSNGDSRGAIATCTSPELLAELDELELGLVAGEMNLASQLLLHTDHRVLAANLHRGYEGVLAAYEIAGASPAEAAATARKHNVDYVILCPDSSTSSTWRDDHPNGLYARLLDDDPPPGFQKVIDEEAGRVYAVQ